MGQQEINFALRIQQVATSFAKVADEMAALSSVFFSRGYSGNFTQDMLEVQTNDTSGVTAPGGTYISAEKVIAFINLTEQTRKFLSNGNPATGDYKTVLDSIRTDY